MEVEETPFTNMSFKSYKILKTEEVKKDIRLAVPRELSGEFFN